MDQEIVGIQEKFSASEIGHITKVREPIHVSTSIAEVESMFFEDEECGSLPVESIDGIVGIIEKHRLQTHKKKGLGRIFDDSIEKLITASPVIIDAEDHIELALNSLFSKSENDAVRNVQVNHRKHLLGTLGVQRIVQQVLKIRQDEMVRARSIQEVLIGGKSLSDDFFSAEVFIEMAHELGGDFTQLVSLPTGRSLLACFDVSGKNLSAAICTGLISGYFSTLSATGAAERISVRDVLLGLNRILTDKTPPDIFVTAIFIIACPDTKSVEIYNCGYNNLFIQTSTSEKKNLVRMYKPTLPPLGLTEDWDPAGGQKLSVKPDTRIFCFSDGLTDIKNEAGKQYGEERVIEFVKKNFRDVSKKFIGALIDDVHGFVGRAMQADDITMMFVQF